MKDPQIPHGMACATADPQQPNIVCMANVIHRPKPISKSDPISRIRWLTVEKGKENKQKLTMAIPSHPIPSHLIYRLKSHLVKIKHPTRTKHGFSFFPSKRSPHRSSQTIRTRSMRRNNIALIRPVLVVPFSFCLFPFSLIALSASGPSGHTQASRFARAHRRGSKLDE